MRLDDVPDIHGSIGSIVVSTRLREEHPKGRVGGVGVRSVNARDTAGTFVSCSSGRITTSQEPGQAFDGVDLALVNGPDLQADDILFLGKLYDSRTEIRSSGCNTHANRRR